MTDKESASKSSTETRADQTLNDQLEPTSSQEENLQDIELNVSDSETQNSKRKNYHFQISETDDTDEDCRVMNKALDALEDETSVPEESATEVSSQGLSQEQAIPNKFQDSKTKAENKGSLTPSRKRPLSLTRDHSSRFYHQEKRRRSRIDLLKNAINNDHPQARNTKNSTDEKVNYISNEVEVFPKANAQSSENALIQDVVPETDDEQLKSGLEAYTLDQEDLDFWKEHAKDKKSSTSSMLRKIKGAAGSNWPQNSVVKPDKRSSAAIKRVQFKEAAESQADSSRKGKSVKSSSQTRRKNHLQSQDSQSSQDYVSSSQDQNSGDEFKPRRTKRKAPKKKKDDS